LTKYTVETTSGQSWAILSGDLLWTDDGANNLSANGAFTAAFDLSPLPNNELFNHDWSGMTISDTGAVGGSFTCVEGTFGSAVAANLCGNYNWGDNFVDEGGAGDDASIGPAQSIADFDPLVFGGYDDVAGILTMTNAVELVSGYTLSFQEVPVPAAAWLFGSALIGLAGIKRKK
jgi:hypothetical protein